MNLKNFKSFTPYLNTAKVTPSRETLIAKLGNLHKYASQDPTAVQWSSRGFAHHGNGIDDPTPEEFFADVDGAALACVVQFNERILPASVRDEKVNLKKAEIERQQGRAVTRKEYAQIKEDVEAQLLPKSLIRRSFVPVFFFKKLILVFTSSAKKADDVMASLGGAFGDSDVFAPCPLANLVKESPAAMLTDLARGDHSAMEGIFEAADAAVLKGDDKQTIRIKDKDVGGADVQALLDQNFNVSQLRAVFYEDVDSADISLTFTLNEKLVVSGLKLSDAVDMHESSEQDKAQAEQASVYIMAGTLTKLMANIVDMMGGLDMSGANAPADKPKPQSQGNTEAQIRAEMAPAATGVEIGRREINFDSETITFDSTTGEQIPPEPEDWDEGLDGEWADSVEYAVAFDKLNPKPDDNDDTVGDIGDDSDLGEDDEDDEL